MEWQPIETAPKDGTRIILLAPKEPQPVTSAKWCGYMWLGGPYDNSSVHPTHWMPFKAPNGTKLTGAPHNEQEQER